MIAASAMLWSSLSLGLGPATAPPAHADPGESQIPIGNPDLTKACGIDINLVLDESGSVGDASSDVQSAFRAFTSALKNTGSRLAVSEFSTVARLPLRGAAQSTYTVVTDETIASTFEPYISRDYRPGGTTDWEDGLRVSRYMLPRPSSVQPHLVVFITDGDPNRIVKNTVSTSDYHTKVPLSENQVSDTSENSAANAAVPNANGLKSAGSHVLALAVGGGLNDSGSLSRLQKISGPDVYPSASVPTFDIATTDVYREADFSKLEQALREAAFQLCAPSVTIRKLVDLTPDPGTSDAVPAPGFALTAVTSPAPEAWVLPPGVTPPTSPTATTSTDANGFASFQWRTPTPTESQVTITEQDPSAGIGGYPPLAFDPASTQCSYRTPESPMDQPLATDPVTLGFSMTVPRDAIVTCTIVNRAPARPGLAIQKSTNGIDADNAPGPVLRAGDPITWTYVVTNTGNTTINELAVVDAPSNPADPAPVVSCPGTSLAPGATMTCSATGAARANQYANTATATGTDSLGTPVGPVTDPSHYMGTAPSIHLEKATNGQDADNAPGPILAVGDPVTWTYVATNTGNSVLTGLRIIDDTEGDVPCAATGALAPGASTTCTLTGTAVEGQYTNNATVTAQSLSGVTVTNSDPSHYFGAAPGVEIEKSTNGEDADSAPGPSIPVGDDVFWAYVVTNTGNVTLHSWDVTDDQVTEIRCPRPFILPGGRVTCTATGRSSVGQHENTATVTASSALLPGRTVTDSDPSHYFGADPGVDIEKSTNAFDADSAPGVYLPVGAPVTWTYTVTNTGNSVLGDITVADDQGVNVLCPTTVLLPGETMLCSGTGTAQEGQYANVATVTGTSLGRTITDADPSHYFGATPKITLEKSTNGHDADTGMGPVIAVGKSVVWVYRVTNDGNVPLTDIEVTDDQGVAVLCPDIEALLPQQSMHCEAQGQAVPGQYENIGRVTATSPLDSQVSAEDPSHYFGSVPSIDIEKSTNGRNADLDPGIPGSDAPYIPVGGAVTWTYEITNTGNTALSGVTVTDDQGVAVTCPGDTLPVGASMTCTGSGTAVPGAYANHGTVIGVSDLDGTVVDDTDPSHYFGSDPRIDIEKFTNGQDADLAPGPSIPVDGDVVWTYLVTNVGNTPLTGITLSDDKVGTVGCAATGPLAPGDTLTCTATGKAAAGQYANVGSVTAVDPGGTPALGPPGSATIGDSDPSHYVGVESSIDLEKATNGMDADLPAGEPGSDAPFVPVGDPVTWTYTLRNTGTAQLADITLEDTVLGPITDCDGSLAGPLAPGGVIICQATGTAMEGEYTNSATVKALGPDLREVSDNDPSNYFGAVSSLVVEKSTNGDDADLAPGSLIEAGRPVEWTYVVINAGNSTLTGVILTDVPDDPSDPTPIVTCAGDAGRGVTLAPGDSVTCTAPGTARIGQYGNRATAVGLDPNNRVVTGSDPSHYFGYVSAIDVQKSTNGFDADDAPGPSVAVGGAVTWTYVVTNAGNLSIPQFTVTDSDPTVSITCPAPDPDADALPVGGSVTCTAAGTAVAGQYANTATVQALDALEQPLSDTDPSHYLGVTAGIDIEKSTNGEDADDAPGPRIPAGDPVTWTYLVTNTGSAPLGSVAVTDDKLGAVPCPTTELEPGASMTCTVQGTAEVGQYANLGTVSGQFVPPDAADPDPGLAVAARTFGANAPVARAAVTVQDSDASHYLGVAPAIAIEKSPDYAEVHRGDRHTFTITVTNTGGLPLTDVVVSDPRLPACDRAIGDLAPGASVSYPCELAEVTADFTNIAQVAGSTSTGEVVIDEDDARVVPIDGAPDGGDDLVGTGAGGPVLLILSALSLIILGAGMRLLVGRH